MQEECLEFVREHTPNLKGLIHSAGILQDSMIMNQNMDKFDGVFNSKNRAAVYLHEALEKHENPALSTGGDGFFWVFSSTSVYGNMGQLNYSGSNSYLDALMRHRRALGKPGMAPQWGAWGDVGMAANLDDASRKRMINSPMPYFSNAEGLAGLREGIATGLPYFSVFKYNAPIMIGMIQGEDMVQQQYQRAMSSEVAPPPPSFNERNVYGILRPRISANLPISRGLVFSTLYPKTAELIEAELEG